MKRRQTKGTLKTKKPKESKPSKKAVVAPKRVVVSERSDSKVLHRHTTAKYELVEEQKAIRNKILSDKKSGKSTDITIEDLRNMIGRRPVMSSEDIRDTIKDIKRSMEYIIIEGKKYKKGEFVEVGAAPYMFYPTGRATKTKGILGELQNITKGGKLIVRDVIAPDDQQYEEEEKYEEQEEKVQEGEYGEAADASDEEDKPVEDEVEKSYITSEKPTKTREKGTMVSEFDYEFKEVDIFTGESKEIAIKFGLDAKQTKLVPVLREDKAKPGAKVVFSRYDRYEVVEGRNGLLQLKYYAPYGYDGATAIDKQETSPSDIALKAPKIPNTPKIPQAHVNYKGSLKFGDCVTFKSSTITESIEGIVTSMKKDRFNLISIGENLRRYVDIPYSNISHVKELDYPEDVRGEHDDQIVIRNKGQDIFIEIDPKKCSGKLCKNIKPNTLIRFKKTKNIHAGSGYITGFTSSGFIVLSKENGPVQIPYTYSMKKIECPKKVHHLKFKPVEIKDVLAEPVIAGTRERVISLFFDLFSNLFDTTKSVTYARGIVEKKEWITDHPRLLYLSDVERDASLTGISDKINWGLHKYGILSWEAYYNVEFNRWLYTKHVDSIKANMPDFTEDAKYAYKEYILNVNNFPRVINQLTDIFGDDLFDGNGVNFVNKIESYVKDPAAESLVILSFILTEFNRIGRDKLITFEGVMLARVITKCLMKYRQLYSKNMTEIKQEIEDKWIHEAFENFKGTAEDQKEFDTKYLGQVSDLYQFLLYNYNENESLIKKYNEAKAVIVKERKTKSADVEEGGVQLNGKVLSTEGVKVYNDIVKMEEKIHTLHSTNLEYLIKVHEILLFLDPKTRPGKYSNFFRAKILSGLYPIEHLDSATIYHAFPEFFINEKLTDDEYQMGAKLLRDDLYNSVVEFAHFWILQHISSIPTVPTFVNPKLGKKEWKNLNDWKNYVVDVPTNCAENGSVRIKKDGIFTGDSKKISDYDCKDKSKGVVKCVAKREPISSDDVILCYSDKKFVCLSINDILFALADRKRGVKKIINPITGEPYTSEFLERMGTRYGDLIEGKKYDHRVLEFEFTKGSSKK